MIRIAPICVLILIPILAACAGGGGGASEAVHDGAGHGHTQMPRRVLPEGAGAPLFNDLGRLHRDISSRSERARSYFDQGLTLAYGFNHAEALRSFQEASRQDPTCAICAWGEAVVLGPNINKPMDPADAPVAWEALQRARRIARQSGASPAEQALIDALAARYAATVPEDRSPLDRAYAEAMREAAERFPDDLDLQTLYAESVMDVTPWDYYLDPETPRPAMQPALAALEHVIASNPDHVGALHFYIHAVEASSSPERGEPAADRLGSLSPGAGHLVHMPSHIYLRVGRYHDASLANEAAADADETYISECRAQGFYPAAYYPHNLHFLYAAAGFEGRSRVSIGAANRLAANISPELVATIPITEEFAPMPLFALVRFGRWDDLMAAEAPPASWRYATGVWHFGRGMAHAAQGRRSEAERELAVLRGIAVEAPLSQLVFASRSTPAQLLSIGAKVLGARIASGTGEWTQAIGLLREAVALQDVLPYTEPPPWYFPTREALGQALLAGGRAGEAEEVFREQLAHTPRNGWSLFGLTEAARAQGKTRAANEAQRRFTSAWERADIELERPVF